MNESTIEITTERYNELMDAWRILVALEDGGVMDWEGYDDAMNVFAEMNEDDEEYASSLLYSVDNNQ